eukprot:jgi/Chlat1/1372/Chrsp119S01790
MVVASQQQQLPLTKDGTCSPCGTKPADADVARCSSCGSPWHVECLLKVPEIAVIAACKWVCPDCDFEDGAVIALQPSSVETAQTQLMAEIRAIQADTTLTEAEKAQKRQQLMCKSAGATRMGRYVISLNYADGGKLLRVADSTQMRSTDGRRATTSTIEPAATSKRVFDEELTCPMCLDLCERPVTTTCGHNFCKKCLQKWAAQPKAACPKCRTSIPRKYTDEGQLRINTALVAAIRLAKKGEQRQSTALFNAALVANSLRPDEAFTTDRAQRAGRANAASDHFGPIEASADPERGRGVLVSDEWKDRFDCRQWGAHRPHVAGIAGQSEVGAQSVALSGGYEDDEDHGEYFLYTGSGGRDLSGNKRTNKKQSSDQTFTNMNKALLVSCLKGLPVRVVRSHKEKRSSYAPKNGVRYDGVYRIEKCWRSPGTQNKLMCRYLFVRCDNEPAPWNTNDEGDRPRDIPEVEELAHAKDNKSRTAAPLWDFDEATQRWGWRGQPPASRLSMGGASKPKTQRQQMTAQQRLLKEFKCGICKTVLAVPATTPCGHNFCRDCLLSHFGKSETAAERKPSGRSLRVRKEEKKCPSCSNNIADFVADPKVNNEMEAIIAKLQQKIKDLNSTEGKEEATISGDDEGDEDQEDEDAEDDAEPEDEAMAAGGSAEVPETDAAQQPQIEAQVSAAADKYAKELAELRERYPQFDEGLLQTLLKQEEADVLAVEVMLKKMLKQEAAMNKKRRAPDATASTGAKRGRPRKKQQS